VEQHLRNLARQAIRDRVFPGCVIGTMRHEMETIIADGRHTYDISSPEIQSETVYDLASITKSIPTATLALQLLDERTISLNTKIVEYIPEYSTSYRDDVTLRHLLTYTLGNTTPLATLKGKTCDEIFDTVCTEEAEAPGTRFSYSNTPAFLLGIVIERVLKSSLDKAAHERIFAPLGMKSTTFHPKSAVPTEEGIQNIVHDESARVFAKAEKTVGHAGLFSNVPDLLLFMRHVLASDTGIITRNYIANLGASTGLGWELNQPHFMGSHPTAHTFGKTGFTGTSIVCDPKRGIAVVILSNRIYPTRPKDASAINEFRRDVCDIVFQS